MIGPTVSFPAKPFGPLQPSDAEQLTAFVLVQDRVEEPPAMTDCGLAVRLTTGVVPIMTLIETDFEIEAGDESQIRSKLASEVSGPTASDPEFARDPAQAPLAMQFDMFEPVQAKVAVPPLVIVEAEVVSVRLPTAGGGVTVGGGDSAVPPDPPHPASTTTDPATIKA